MKTNIEIDRSFDSDYDCRVLDEIPNGAAVSYYLPDQPTRVGQDGVLLKISPKGLMPWNGLFSSVKKYPGTLSRVLFTPNPNMICVICSGDAVIADVMHPDQYKLLDFEPITDAIVVKEREMIVFAGFTKLMAFDGSGIVWMTSRISWDALQLTDVDVSQVSGEYWDIASETRAEFEVNLATGNVRGAAEIPLA